MTKKRSPGLLIDKKRVDTETDAYLSVSNLVDPVLFESVQGFVHDALWNQIIEEIWRPIFVEGTWP